MKNRMPLMVAMSAIAVLAGGYDRSGCEAARPKCAKVTVEPGRVLAETDFARGLGGWKVTNYRDILTIATTNGGLVDGGDVLYCAARTSKVASMRSVWRTARRRGGRT